MGYYVTSTRRDDAPMWVRPVIGFDATDRHAGGEPMSNDSWLFLLVGTAVAVFTVGIAAVVVLAG